MRLSGKRAIITGAGRGIGFAIARSFLHEGARVLLNDIDPSLLDEAVQDLAPFAERCGALVGDVSDPVFVPRLVAVAQKQLGGVEVLVNNAGIGGTGKTLLQLSIDEWERMIRVDLTSVFLCCQAVTPTMIEQGRGSIINLASITGLQGASGSVPYAAAKAGVIGLTKALARELAPHRVNVNAIAPGLIDTVMSQARGQEASRAQVLWPRIGEPEDIAHLAVYLGSDESEFMTGQVLSVNGGALM